MKTAVKRHAPALPSTSVFDIDAETGFPIIRALPGTELPVLSVDESCKLLHSLDAWAICSERTLVTGDRDFLKWEVDGLRVMLIKP